VRFINIFMGGIIFGSPCLTKPTGGCLTKPTPNYKGRNSV